jgi:hypothetical protein
MDPAPEPPEPDAPLDPPLDPPEFDDPAPAWPKPEPGLPAADAPLAPELDPEPELGPPPEKPGSLDEEPHAAKRATAGGSQ